METREGYGGESLPLVAAALAAQLSQGRRLAELELLSAFFAVLGDNLALIAVERANLSEKNRQDSVKSQDCHCTGGQNSVN